MLDFLFESRTQARLDAREVDRLQARYGEALIDILKQRSSDSPAE